MKRAHRSHDVTETCSPRQALDMLKSRTFGASLYDFSLEASDGLDVWQRVRMQYPDTVRFLVTGNRDIEIGARAVNDVAVHGYCSEPWNADKLCAAIELRFRTLSGLGGA
jgi:ActR/RegA family two-component response regulator